MTSLAKSTSSLYVSNPNVPAALALMANVCLELVKSKRSVSHCPSPSYSPIRWLIHTPTDSVHQKQTYSWYVLWLVPLFCSIISHWKAVLSSSVPASMYVVSPPSSISIPIPMPVPILMFRSSKLCKWWWRISRARSLSSTCCVIRRCIIRMIRHRRAFGIYWRATKSFVFVAFVLVWGFCVWCCHIYMHTICMSHTSYFRLLL